MTHKRQSINRVNVDSSMNNTFFVNKSQNNTLKKHNKWQSGYTIKSNEYKMKPL
jgi:hypothetical protein